MKLYAVSSTKGKGLVDAVFSTREKAEEWLEYLHTKYPETKVKYRVTFTELDSPMSMFDLGIYNEE